MLHLDRPLSRRDTSGARQDGAAMTGFPYGDVGDVVANQLREISECIRTIDRTGMVEKGRKLLTAKELIGKHGRWLPWLEHEFGWSERTAQRYMGVARLVAKNDNLSFLLPSALQDLAVAPAEAVAEVERRLAKGERPSRAEIRDIIAEAEYAEQEAQKRAAREAERAKRAAKKEAQKEERKAEREAANLRGEQALKEKEARAKSAQQQEDTVAREHDKAATALRDLAQILRRRLPADDLEESKGLCAAAEFHTLGDLASRLSEPTVLNGEFEVIGTGEEGK